MVEKYKISKQYAIGDLVINLFPLELFDGCKIKEDSIGLVVGIVGPSLHLDGYDYMVLINGREIFFFEKELSLFKKGEDK